MTDEELMERSKEYLIQSARMFQSGLKMWRAAYKAEVGEERYQDLLRELSCKNETTDQGISTKGSLPDEMYRMW